MRSIQMTPKEFADAMEKIDLQHDTAQKHIDADRLIIKLLKEIGYSKGAITFEKMDKWYE